VLLVDNSLQAKSINLISCDERSMESFIVQINIPLDPPILIACTYRLPNSDLINFNLNLEKLLSSLNNTREVLMLFMW